MDKYDSFILTEKTDYEVSSKGKAIYTVPQINRKEKNHLLKFIGVIGKTFYLFCKLRPNVVVCTGVLAMLPMCIFVKITGGKLIYIESFAKIDSPTQSGKLMYPYADYFFVQWKKMLEIYPKAIYCGGIY